MDMKTLPDTATIRASLMALGHAQMQALAAVSGVPFTTLWKIRSAETRNPGIETVRQFLPHINAEAVLNPKAAA